MKNNKKYFSKKGLAIAMFFLPTLLMAQDDSTAVTSVVTKEYVKATFENSIVLNNQTIENTQRKTLDFMIQHRFSVIDNAKDLWGIYGPSNIRLGLAYGLTKNISVGAGVTKNNMIYDFQIKANILRQTKDNKMPVSVTYYGCMGLEARADDNFINQDSVYKFANKLTYFNEIMVARKFNDKISIQVGVTYSHMNLIDTAFGQHDFVGISAVARYKFSPMSSIMIDYDYLLNVSGIPDPTRPKANMTIGYEVSTGSHQFQIFVGTASQIVNQEYRVYNQNQISELQFLFGFNITRIWDFR